LGNRGQVKRWPARACGSGFCSPTRDRSVKGRILQTSPGTGQAEWRNLATWPKQANPPGRPLFVNTFGREIGRDDFYRVVPRIQERDGVDKADVHLMIPAPKGHRWVSALTTP